MNIPVLPQPEHRFSAVDARRDAPCGATPPKRTRPLGESLVHAGLLDAGDLTKALALQRRENARLGEILAAQNMTSARDIRDALAAQYRLKTREQPFEIASELRRSVDPEDCLSLGFAPVRRFGNTTEIAISDLTQIDAIKRKLPDQFGQLEFCVAPICQIQDAIARAYPHSLTRRAETLTQASQSCRSGLSLAQKIVLFVIVSSFVASAILAPLTLLKCLLGMGLLAMLSTMVLKCACLLAALRRPRAPGHSKETRKLPKFSVLVPLYGEAEIASTLVQRLSRLSYPKELLDIVLVLEADDALTQATVARTRLPDNMRAVVTPEGTLKTKPRALNYALDFIDGDLVGVYDAEDAPAPDQLHKVARCFAHGDDDLACVQGVLSFYNWSRNWLARCFFFEYAGWFRVMLPGLERLGFAIPLGGTTLFFRRDVLRELGGWDAHNVTEDADLGMRLARFGYRTQMVHSITQEEANCRVWPWVRQRSRWLKGYAVTWGLHMRAPTRLLRELGLKRFIGFQVLFLGTLTSFFLAPAFWITSGLMLGGGLAPAQLGLSAQAFLAVSLIFLLGEVLNVAIYWAATRLTRDRPSRLWVFTLPVYFVLASLAAYKAFVELWRNPFFWDKTHHGAFGGTFEEAIEADASNVVEFSRVDLQPDLEGDGEVIPQRL